ncbi:MAG: 2-C-methyl-D-erythritol 2,4-cyclodiphosphate synthase [Candidatus Raymondbacteria bacterium RifOxyA12_full_50_37]|uniref:2-C-methyl-D-erythritol 2,4-cyclodiphosphate synthase n=1 Tax=Candidatus Raymondbacteria bacterium RIFOXYD12_FULL_49_13 TaxID=1817890 RepID=A0A1F7FK49_UNCRA|nr:MAG: 2-C-methyl-D-erythritol 2,4-cyclodiphosphate synthase [Candidatus Raymondbacteria bacterium RifOxyA12_full_50_37]OGJ90831.1 MAG: 2-C-methyl-D-erythritol 2,4-cyclodiphosphate synthase [Candidatus Raymondbacteria bacterium RIFOXYA2_FULL_49_16]OGJ98639.1 MAG: 2-C-methyl-D-erythritol 2,4-cyclodiphosphate synthase [Candidatus Raymondbacteria bacterium RIFOXYC2_FULL_50_21]OGK00409.1 MAG: 2-C-methyl-D-erythritol 2,4-cyclodiphosphate synthase [Candidatus Raymondbacteria bacterium RifOxyB12_full_
MDFRIGTGFDVHRLVEGRKLVLGSVHIPHGKGLLGHSDADVLLHAIADALLGALALGDIGVHFPDTDPAYKNADSAELLFKVYDLVLKKGYIIANVDCTVIAEEPKIMPFAAQMRKNIAGVLNTQVENVSVKATTTEGMGYTGRGEGIAAQAIVLLCQQ